MKGFTMIEIIIAMVIASLTGVLLIVILINSFGLFSNNTSQVTEGLNINDVLMQFRSAIKQASAVENSSNANKLVLKVASFDSSNNIISDKYDNFTFYLDKSVLHFQIICDAASSRKEVDRIFSTLVDSLAFQYLNNANPPQEVSAANATKVRMSLVLKQRAGASYVTNIATAEAKLRND